MLALALIAGISALVFAWLRHTIIQAHPSGTPAMQDLSREIRLGAMAFLSREYRTILPVALIISGLLWLVIPDNLSTSYPDGLATALAFLAGSACSAFIGYIGMRSATQANVRTAEAAKSSLSAALRVAFDSGLVTAMCVTGIGLLGVMATFFIFGSVNILFGFSFGASTVALFARLGGGIFTKSADIGADLVGKVEEGFPEDDPRNPAVIADNVGDNVGDVVGMSADLFESYVGSVISAMALGYLAFGESGLILPLLLCGIGIFASIMGSYFVRRGARPSIGQVHRIFHSGLIAATIAVMFGAFFLTRTVLPAAFPGSFIAIIAGLFAGVAIGWLTEYHTSAAHKPTRQISQSAQAGPATVVLQGLSLGYLSTALPVVVIATTIYISHAALGAYGIALAAVGMLSTLGYSLAVDTYGSVVDNAGGIAQMAGLPRAVRARTDCLDSVGNTTAAIGKGFAIGAAALTALAFFALFGQEANLSFIDLMSAKVIIGVLLGAMIPFLFTSLSIRAVGRTAQAMVTESRRQLAEIKGMAEGKAKPDTKRCVDIATKSALREMTLPGIIAISAPVVCGLVLGVSALGGLLAGALGTGLVLSLSMANSGAAWDNAKKHIEKTASGTDAHKAAVVGDTVGDPLKDTAGPSVNILIKLMSIVALIALPLFLAFGPLVG